MEYFIILGAILTLILLLKTLPRPSTETPQIPTSESNSLSKIKQAIESGSLHTNISIAVDDNSIRFASVLTQILNSANSIGSALNIDPLYLLTIAYAETHFGYNFYDPIGQGYGLSQMESIQYTETGQPRVSTLYVNACYILNFLANKLDTRVVENVRRIYNNLSDLKASAQNHTVQRDIFIVITDDTNPLIDIPTNFALIAAHLIRAAKTHNLTLSMFNTNTAYRAAYYYNKGIRAEAIESFESWLARERGENGYAWRIDQLIAATE